MDWRVVREFPSYSVSDEGVVRNDETDRFMSVNVNQAGIPYVGLSSRGVQHRRSLSLLVAQAYHKPKNDTFRTPINLDGNRFNCRADNIMWRPRWFAIKYFRQFLIEPAGIRRPIIELSTHEKFENSWDAATKYGLLDLEILAATVQHTYVWPTFQMFEIIRQSRY